MFDISLLSSITGDASFDEFVEVNEAFWAFCVFWGAFLSLISMAVTALRIYGVYNDWEKAKTFPSLLVSHLAMMGFFTIYAILNFWNFAAFYSKQGAIGDCNVWYYFIVVTWHGGRICLYSFLLLRTHLIFKGSFAGFSNKVFYGLVVMNATMVSFFMLSWILVSEAFAIPTTGFCKRIVTNENYIWASVFYDLFASIVILSLFGYIASKVTRVMTAVYSESRPSVTQKDGSSTKAYSGNVAIVADPENFEQSQKMFNTFQKHVILGFLTVIGSFVTCFALMFFHVLTGFIIMADTTSNIILVHLMFTPESRIYDKLCCCLRWSPVKKPTNESQMAAHITDGGNSKARNTVSGHVSAPSGADSSIRVSTLEMPTVKPQLVANGSGSTSSENGSTDVDQSPMVNSVDQSPDSVHQK